ncbi:MAG TPA: DUF1501 domain-containing protein [Gemmataceae bacterium]|jgi:uncharacterized protein (DUF1501 family)
MRRANDLTRRQFLGTCAAAVPTLGRPAFARPAADRRCILLWLTGGPSHIDTFDPKPDAPAEVRGPFRTMRTRVPGLHVTELFPRLADRTDRVAFVRSLHHDEAPIHETGQQLLQTGRLCRGGREFPHVGAALAALGRGPWAVLPGPLGDTGVDVSHGQTAGPLGEPFGPQAFGSGAARQPHRGFGDTPFGHECAEAVRLVESGFGLVVVNMFSTVYRGPSWDCHADGGALNTTLADYADTVAPMFDQAFAALLDDLHDRGLLDSTLVLAAGEFGRTPYLNPRGGRDHWPGAWTVLLAGAGVRGGAVIGASDALGGEPADRPISPAELTATVYHALGVEPRTTLPTPAGPLTLADAEPIRELF